MRLPLKNDSKLLCDCMICGYRGIAVDLTGKREALSTPPRHKPTALKRADIKKGGFDVISKAT